MKRAHCVKAKHNRRAFFIHNIEKDITGVHLQTKQWQTYFKMKHILMT